MSFDKGSHRVDAMVVNATIIRGKTSGWKGWRVIL